MASEGEWEFRVSSDYTKLYIRKDEKEIYYQQQLNWQDNCESRLVADREEYMKKIAKKAIQMFPGSKKGVSYNLYRCLLNHSKKLKGYKLEVINEEDVRVKTYFYSRKKPEEV